MRTKEEIFNDYYENTEEVLTKINLIEQLDKSIDFVRTRCWEAFGTALVHPCMGTLAVVHYWTLWLAYAASLFSTEVDEFSTLVKKGDDLLEEIQNQSPES